MSDLDKLIEMVSDGPVFLSDDEENLIESILEERKGFIKALEFYADPISYALTQNNEPRSAVHGDNGKLATQALTKRN